MPRWSKAELEAYEARRLSSRAQPERTVQDEPVAKTSGKTIYPNGIHVIITSFRRRLIDPDNLCPKYFIDCLRYAGIIKNDTAKDIELSVRQTKVKTKSEERTEIEVI